VHIHRHTATVITDGERPVAVQNDIDLPRKTRQGFIDAVVDDLLRAVN
jgi:hypothetical protein